jgi:hypothetical protein
MGHMRGTQKVTPSSSVTRAATPQVIVDQDTIFASLLFNRDAVPGQPAFPRDIMNWTETLYQPAFAARPGFRLREHGARAVGSPLVPSPPFPSLRVVVSEAAAEQQPMEGQALPGPPSRARARPLTRVLPGWGERPVDSSPTASSRVRGSIARRRVEPQRASTPSLQRSVGCLTGVCAESASGEVVGCGGWSDTLSDYVYGEHKFGGNAQSITKGRWVHHTSLLWDFHPPNMELLKFPPKSPDYRKVGPRPTYNADPLTPQTLETLIRAKVRTVME